jgi:hypothetical protein
MTQSTLLPAVARTATTNSADQIKSGDHGIHVIIKMTAVPGIDTVTPRIQGKDIDGAWYDLLVGAAIVATSTVVMKLGIGLPVTANLSAPDYIPDVWRVAMTHSAATSFTYSVSVNVATQ